MRYSYVEPDGETYDISEIMEEELRDDADKGDLLEGVVRRNNQGGDRGINEKLERVLGKVKDGRAQFASNGSLSTKSTQDSLLRPSSPSDYSLSGAEATPSSAAFPRQTDGGRTPTPTSATYPGQRSGGSRATTPTAIAQARMRQPSIASVMSDLESTPTERFATPIAQIDSRYATPVAQLSSPTWPTDMPPKAKDTKKAYLENDFGISDMLAVIEVRADSRAQKPKSLEPLHPVDALLFGRDIDEASLHPQIRDVYSGVFQQLRDIDKVSAPHLFSYHPLLSLG
jgi:hypothetical protein